MKRAKTFAITIAALALGVAPWARAECSEETLKGTFAYTSTGFIVAAPVAALVDRKSTRLNSSHRR